MERKAFSDYFQNIYYYDNPMNAHLYGTDEQTKATEMP